MSSPAKPRALRAACSLAFAAISVLTLLACGGDDSTFQLLRGDGGDLDATTADANAPDGSPADAAPSDGGDGGDAADLVCAAGTPCNGECVDLNQGRNCGACGNSCGAGMVCDLGTCASFCGAGTTACNASCVNTLTDTENCGGCNTVCPGGQVCSAGTCGVACGAGLTQCAPPGSSGDAGVDGGVSLCIDMLTDRQNCGGCGIACASGQVCSEGTCAATCQPGLVNCNQSCVDPKTSGQHCGATAGCGADAGSSGTVCPSGQVCTAGTCQTSCLANEVQCNGSCIDPLTNPEFCGASGSCTTTAGDNVDSAGSICPTGQVCSAGACAISCQPNQVKCGDSCVDPTTSLAHCGAKGDCSTANGGVDCTLQPGTVCSFDKTSGVASCAVKCPTGEVQCNGICVDPLTNNAFCGAKGNCTTTAGDANDSAGDSCTSHPGTICDGKGSCSVTCTAGEVLCGGICINPLTSPSYCGVDGTCAPKTGTTGVCTGNQVCNAGTCATTCATGLVNCGGVCVDPTSDNLHCGVTATCGGGQGNAGVCPSGTVCTTVAGATSCSASCGTGLSVCTNSCVNEKVDPSHCGSCSPCTPQTNVTSDDCISGICQVGVCKTGFANCNATTADGCEVNISGNPSNCGSCGKVCALANVATDTCSAFTCGIGTCSTGFADCDNAAATGCEVNITNDASNCGGCGNACAAGQSCISGSCDTIVTGSVTINQTATPVTATAGQMTAIVGSAAGLATGQEVLLHQTQLAAGGAGAYERATIASIAGTTVTFNAALAHTYTNTGGAAQLVVMQQYTGLDLPAGSSMTAPAWNGTTGGILAIDVGSGSYTIAGSISMSGNGYRGVSQEACGNNCGTGFSGESSLGEGQMTNVENGGGGGGGGNGQDCGMGGGGSYGTAGGRGAAPDGTNCNDGLSADPGDIAGSGDLTASFLLGAAGGSGGTDEDGDWAGHGANGGGAILLFGGSITITGSISADGAAGGNGVSNGQCGNGGGCGMGGGGGGAGGAVRILVSGTATLGAGIVHGVGGGGGACTCAGIGSASGGSGRIDVKAASLTGTSSPIFTTN